MHEKVHLYVRPTIAQLTGEMQEFKGGGFVFFFVLHIVPLTTFLLSAAGAKPSLFSWHVRSRI